MYYIHHAQGTYTVWHCVFLSCTTGVQNVLGKRLGSRSTLNNARVTLKALGQLRTLSDYAEARGVPLDYMLS